MKPSGRPSAHGLASLSVCAFALAALEPSGPALAQFSFVKVVGIGDPSPAGAPFVALAYPKLNDRGQIAFLGYAGASFPGTKGLFLVRGSEIEKVALEGDAAPGGGTFTFDYVNLDLNDQGQVAFVTGAGGGAHAIFLYSLGNLSQVVRTGDIPSGAFTSLDNPAINNSGEIAFTGGYPQGGGIFKVGIAGGPAAKVWIKGDNAPSGGTFESTLRPPAINDAGQVAAEAGVVGDFTLQDGTPFSGQLSGIFVGGAGQPKRIALAGVNTDGGVFAPPDLSSGGDLAYGFESSFVPPRWRLYRGSLQKVAATGDGTPAGGKFGILGLGLLRPDRLSDRSQIVFDATVDGGSSPLGIFLSRGGGSVKVVAVGDPTPQGGVFGELSSPTINDLSCIAFVGLTRGVPNSGAIYACDPAVGFDDLSLTLYDAMQPVQVSWQKDPGSEPDYPASDDMERTGERSWAARLPMVQGKATRVFGYDAQDWQAWGSIPMSVLNYSFRARQAQVLLEIVDPTGAVRGRFPLSGVEEIPGASLSETAGSRQLEASGPVLDMLSLRFPEPGTWQLRAVLRSPDWGPLADADPENDQVTVSVEVKATPKLRVLYKPLIFEDDAQGYPAGFFRNLPASPTSGNWWHSTFLQATFPLAEGDYVRAYDPIPQQVYFDLPFQKIATLAAWKDWRGIFRRWDLLAAVVAQVPALTRIKGSYDRVVVLVPPSTGRDNPGMLSVDGAVGLHYPGTKPVALVEWNENSDTVCHELGHSFGLYIRDEKEQYAVARVNPGLGFSAFGYWVNVDLPRNHGAPGLTLPIISFMGAGTGLWVAKPDYRRLLVKFTVPELDPEVLLVRGVLWNDGRFESRPWHRFDGTVDVLPGTAGSHAIALVDHGGSQLLSMGFTPEFHVHADYVGNEPIDSASFAFTVPFVPGAARVQVLGPGGSVLEDRAITAHAPRVAITSPRAGDRIVESTHAIAWDASDEDGGDLAYTVYLSSAEEEGWSPLAGDLRETEHLWSFIGELAAGEYRLSVVATDGVNTGEAQVGPFTVSVPSAGGFLRGDSNADGAVDISDPIATLGWLFLGAGEPTCLDAADANDDGTVDISDAVYTLGYLFSGSEPPPAPGPEACGPDPTADELGCEAPPDACPRA